MFEWAPHLWDLQVSGLNRILHESLEGMGQRLIYQSPTGTGKCLHPETPVMLFTGAVLPANQIAVGDRLMGPDSKPRTVLSTCSGESQMYRVIPTKGDSYVVNDAHILTLRMNGDASGYKKGQFVDISISDYLAETKTFRHCAKGYRCAVDFPDRNDTTISPYVLGLWLGDGTRKSQNQMTLGDKDIGFMLPEIRQEAEKFGLSVVCKPERNCQAVRMTGGQGNRVNAFTNAMRLLGLGPEKFVPDPYLYGSRLVRLDVLAGLMDTDGYHNRGGFEFCSKDRQLADDVVFISRSLGMAAYLKVKVVNGNDYYRVHISGECDLIPCRTRKKAQRRKMNKDACSVGIKVEPIGEGEYCGWTLDGDGRFLLGDFTVTHNTMVAQEIFRYCQANDLGGNFYVNRKLLIGQSFNRFRDSGLYCGVRAAEFDDMFDPEAPFQVTSAQSEDARVYKSGRWDMHEVGAGGFVLVDEAHMQKSKVMRNILQWYENQGANIVLLTATPTNMKKWADGLIVSGSLSQWRKQGALVLIHPYTISQPDLSKVKKNAQTGEYVMDEDKKKRFCQSIVGDVIDSFERLNQGGPAMMYAPGVRESRWLVSQMAKRGHKFIHVDATDAYIDGEKHTLNRSLWNDIVGQVKDGTVKGLSSRFKLREGIDIPAADHCILATPIGSLSSFLQIIGRVMRSAPGKTHAVLQDHGGVYHQHGSPNHDRDWDSLWQLSDYAASSLQSELIREKVIPEPIRCPKCGFERARGPKCLNPACGYEHEQSERKIVMEDGSIRLVNGNIIKTKKRKNRSDTEQLWTRLYYGYKNKKVNQSFSQMEAYFYREHHYYPERNLPFMPRRAIDWKAKVHEVPMERLTGRHKGKETG